MKEKNKENKITGIKKKILFVSFATIIVTQGAQAFVQEKVMNKLVSSYVESIISKQNNSYANDIEGNINEALAVLNATISTMNAVSADEDSLRSALKESMDYDKYCKYLKNGEYIVKQDGTVLDVSGWKPDYDVRTDVFYKEAGTDGKFVIAETSYDDFSDSIVSIASVKLKNGYVLAGDISFESLNSKMKDMCLYDGDCYLVNNAGIVYASSNGVKESTYLADTDAHIGNMVTTLIVNADFNLYEAGDNMIKIEKIDGADMYLVNIVPYTAITDVVKQLLGVQFLIAGIGIFVLGGIIWIVIAKILNPKLEIPKFTLIGATTRSDMLSKPLRDRFGLSYRMELYTTEELQEIAMRTASIFNIEMRKDGALLLAENARGTPRIVNKYVARARDIAVVEEVPVDANVARQALDTLGVVNDGLDETDILILERLAEFSKPIGLNTLANIIGEDTETIEGVYEPYLLKTGLILKTPKGRIISEKGANLVHRNTPSYPIQQAFA